ncbi:hypothetical protein [Salarchaeum japonicum]|uniref:Uncharacterized protein n=1 Tax=Salarchaeum japonicum TaxID=555573 RepID=A0AAV3T3U6_9EURY|nr:hypothetical protein [Salarchaeum japonicum]
MTGDDRQPATFGGLVLARVRADPRLVVPFVAAGVVVAAVDWLRRADPLPAGDPVWMYDTVSVQYNVFPAGVARTTRQLGAFVHLELPALAWAVALEALAALAVAAAGWYTITRCLTADPDSLAGYAGWMVALAVLPGLVSLEGSVGLLPLGLAVLVVVAFVVAYVFLLPGFLAAGYRFDRALRRSGDASHGRRLPFVVTAVVLGLGAWLLARVPVAGGFLSTAVVGTVQAVLVGALVDRYETRGDADDASGER